MQAMYGVKCVDVSTVRLWVWQFKQDGCSKSVASREINIFTEGKQKLVFFSSTQCPNPVPSKQPQKSGKSVVLKCEKHKVLKLT